MVTEHDMYPKVKECLRRRFPASDGWKIKHRERRNGYEPDFIVERRVGKQIERVVVEVKAVCKITSSHVKQINEYAKKLAGRNVKVVGKILVVPAHADTSIVPSDIEKIYLKSFYCK